MGKIPISDTFIVLAEMDCVDIGGQANSPHIQDTFPRFAAIVFSGTKKQAEQTDGGIRDVMVASWFGVFGSPYILIAEKYSRLIGTAPRDFCTGRNVRLLTVIPARHRSLGKTARMRRYFRGRTEQLTRNGGT